MGHFTVRVLVLLATDGPPLDIPRQGRPVAAVEDVRLEGCEGEWSRLLVSLTARVGSVTWTTDGAGSQQGSSGSCSQRIAWSDDMPLGEAGEAPGPSPRGSGARRTDGFVKARLLRDAKAVVWRLSMLPGRIEDIRISARVDRVEGLAGGVEAAFVAGLQGE